MYNTRVIGFGVSTLVTAGCSIEAAAAAVRRAGYGGIEWRIHADGPIRTSNLEADIRMAVRASENEGLVSLGVAGYLPLTEPNRLLRDVDAAARLGTPRLRPWWPEYAGNPSAVEVFSQARRSMEVLAPVLEASGVTIVLKTHRRSIIPTASAAKRLVEPFSPDLYRVLYDPGNTVTSGLEDPRFAVDILGNHLAHVHVKNSGWDRVNGRWQWGWLALDEGMVHWPSLLQHLLARRFDDWLVNENFLLIAPDQRPAIDEILTSAPSFYADLEISLVDRLAADRTYLQSFIS